MSPVEIMALSGAVPTSPSTGEAADASVFEGALAQQRAATQPSRGRLTTGQTLHQQAQTPAPRQTGLLTSAVAEVAAAEAPAPVAPTDVAPVADEKSAAIGTASAAIEADATTPAAGDGNVAPTPTPTPPGETVAATGGEAKSADPAAPGGAPDVQTPLTRTADQLLADGAVHTAEQVVAAGPDIQPLETAPQAETPEMVLPTPSAETPDAPAAAPAAPAASSSGQASEIENGRVAETAKADAGAKAEAPVADDAQVAPAAPREATPASSQTSLSPQAVAQRADAPLAQRLSFDAVAQLSAQIVRKLEGRSTRFEMELHPLDLGRVDVRVDIDDQGRLAARLAFDNPVAGADLRGRADELRRQLEDAGFQLAQDAFSFAEREGSREQPQDQGGRRRLMVHGLQLAEAADLAAQPSLRAAMRAGLDVRI